MNIPMIKPLASSSAPGLLQESSDVQPLLQNEWANGHIRCHRGSIPYRGSLQGITSPSSHGQSPHLGVVILFVV